MRIARVNERPFPFLTAPGGIGDSSALPSVEDLSDVDTTGIVNGETLVWDAASSTWIPGTGGGATGGSDHEHIMDVLFNGDASTTAFELPAAPFDAYSVAAYVAGTLTEVTLSGLLLTTATFGSAPGSGTNNIRFDIVAAVV